MFNITPKISAEQLEARKNDFIVVSEDGTHYGTFAQLRSAENRANELPLAAVA